MLERARLYALKQLPSDQPASPASVASSLRDLDIDTFFGRILFNRFGHSRRGTISVTTFENSVDAHSVCSRTNIVGAPISKASYKEPKYGPDAGIRGTLAGSL